MDYLILGLSWTAWCTVHSLLISMRATRWLQSRLGDRYRYFRLFFNLFAGLSLVPVLIYSHLLSTPPFLSWSGPWRLLQVPMLAASLWLFAAGAGKYDLLQFLGIRQVREHESARGLTRTGGIDTTGILSLVRHPWYTGAILLLWSRNLDAAALVTNLVLTTYLVVGTWLEERKLVREFGREYRDYQQRVPMLIPFLRKGGKPGTGGPK